MLWQPAGFWRRDACNIAAIHVLGLLPPHEPTTDTTRQPSLAAQLAQHPVEALSALAQRSARNFW